MNTLFTRSMNSTSQSHLSFSSAGVQLQEKVRGVNISTSNSLPVIYHPEASHFSESKFAIKCEFSGVSYLIEGAYHLSNNLRFHDDSLEKSVDLVVIDRILPYKAGAYRFAPISKKEESILSKIGESIVKNPYYNTYLTARFIRN
jgi:hypothetical protein